MDVDKWYTKRKKKASELTERRWEPSKAVHVASVLLG